MISYRSIREYNTIPSNGKEWMLDSGGFKELQINGEYTFSPKKYLHDVRKYKPDYFFVMDWMCESHILKRTGLSVREHQERTIENHIKLLDLMEKFKMESELATVLQGWTIDQYLEHITMFRQRGLLTDLVGIGSVCRRNAEQDILSILKAINTRIPNRKLHAFGVKQSILKYPIAQKILYSCDSSAWSFAGRWVEEKPCEKCKYPNWKNCGNCEVFMKKWKRKVLKTIKESQKQKLLV